MLGIRTRCGRRESAVAQLNIVKSQLNLKCNEPKMQKCNTIQWYPLRKRSIKLDQLIVGNIHVLLRIRLCHGMTTQVALVMAPLLASVTRKKSPNVYKSCPKMMSLEK